MEFRQRKPGQTPTSTIDMKRIFARPGHRERPGARRFFLLLAFLTVCVLGGAAAARAQEWLPARHRYKGVFDAGLVGNYGIQFQRVITWNEGTADAGKRGWIVTGQDENGVRVSYDYGATWTLPRLSGMFCSKIAGLLLNTDDNLFVAMGGMFGEQEFGTLPDVYGVYVGDASLLRATRVEITRPVGPGPNAAGGGKRAFTNVNYAGNSVIRSSNFLARRPQTGGLSDAQRPIWALEQVRTADATSFTFIGLFKSTDSGASFSFVRELPADTYASGKNGIYHILAARNGDVVLLGEAGLWLSQDQGLTFAKMHPASGNIDISSGVFFGGDANTPSGMRIGVHSASASGGVWESTNIRTTAFTKLTGSAGLPANYSVWHLGASPVNPDRLAVCSDVTNPTAPPYLSTDGGRSFTPVTEKVGTGDEQWRYVVRRGHAGFHFCPTDEFVCVIPTFQTMARSLNGGLTSDGDLAAGFDGLHAKGNGFDALTGDWRKILRVCQDSWVNTSADGMHWIAANGLGTGNNAFRSALNAAGAGSNGYVSGAGGVIAPNNRIIAAANCNAGGQPNIMVILDLDPAGQTTTYHIATPQMKSRASHSRRSPKNADVAFVGRWAISNLGAGNPADVVFTDHSSHEIFDCFLDSDGSTLISYWANVTSGGSDDGTAIYRSTHDTGSNNQSTPWYSLPSSSFGDSAICADHFNPERVLYVRNDNREVIRQIRRDGTELKDEVLLDGGGNPVNLGDRIRAVLAAENPGVTVPARATSITQLIADPNKAGVFYAIAGMHGMPNWWRTVDDGKTWTNISGNAPRTLWTGVIHPMTGELMGFGSMGEHIHRSPPDYPALPNRDALSNQLQAYFDAAPPTVFAYGTLTSGTASIQPALPAGIVTNDLLLLFVETANEAVAIADSNGGTWTETSHSPQGTGTPGGSAATRLTAFWSRYNGSQGAPTLSDPGDHQIARMIAIRGAEVSGDPLTTTSGGVETAAVTGGNIPGGTTIVGNSLVILATAASHGTPSGGANLSAWSNPSLVGLVECFDHSEDSGNGGTLAVATGFKTAAGTYGNTGITLSAPSALGMMSIAIRPGGSNATLNSVPRIITTTLPNGIEGTGYHQALVATGGDGALIWSIDSGALPDGLGLSANGTISGTPAAAGTARFTVRVGDSDERTGPADEDALALAITIAPAQVGTFTSENIGNPTLIGSASYAGAAYTVTAGGTDIFGTSDQFRFMHQPWTGDGRIIARVASLENTHAWAKAGVMVRESMDADARHAGLLLTPGNGMQLLCRANTAEATQYTTVTGPVAPGWLRLERHGDTLAGWQSIDGTTWFLVATAKVLMNPAAHIGLAVTSHNEAETNTAVFDHVSIAAAPAWTSQDVGGTGAAGSSSVDYLTDRHTIRGSGNDIGGTGDAFHFRYQAWTAGDATLVAEVLSVEPTHPYAKAGLMIRQSLADNAAHVTVDVTPANGIEMLTRTLNGGATTQQLAAGISAPRFLKLVRAGSTFTAHHSPDGRTWFQVGAPVTTLMTGTVYVGLVSCSHVPGTPCTAVFSSVHASQDIVTSS